MTEPKLPPEYADLSLRDLLRLYTGPAALPIPEALREWVDVAQRWDEVERLRRSNEERQRALERRQS